MAWVDGKWVPEDDSVVTKLNGLLASDSTYIKQARSAGQRTAARRGLQNSSIAAGASEASAIAAAAPLASQDAANTAQKNEAVLSGDIQLRNSTTLQGQSDTAAMQRQVAQQGAQAELARLDNEAQMLRQKEAGGVQLTLAEKNNLAELERTRDQLASQERQALLAADTSKSNAALSAQTELKSAYLQGFANLASNSKLKPAVRDSYIAEMQRVSQQTQQVASSIADVPLNWSGGPTTSTTPKKER